MIELKLLTFSDLYEDYLTLIHVIGWVLEEIKRRYREKITSESGSIFGCFDEDYENGRFVQGFVIVHEKDKKRMNALIVCEDNDMGKELLKILQQPEESYRGKYVACQASEEPVLVSESQETTAMEEKEEVADKMEET